MPIKKVYSEFTEFISRGNVIDLAVGVVIGGAITQTVNSLVNDIFMPVIGSLFGGIHFTDLTITVGDTSINYGNFFQNVFNFLIIALCLFAVIRLVNRVHHRIHRNTTPTKSSTPEEKLLIEIRDLLKKQTQKD